MPRFPNVGQHIERGGVDPQRIRKCPLVVFDECSVEYILTCREVNPGAWFVVRWWYDVAVQDAMMAAPIAAAETWFIHHKADIERLKGERTVFQGLNEVGDVHNEAHACFERRRIALLHGMGAYGGVGAWSVGCPREDLWPAWVQVLDIMAKGRDALLMHLYWANPNDTRNPWHVARWKLPQVAPFVAGQTILGTEGGRDRVKDQGLPESQWGYAGWHKDPNLNTEQYLAEIADAAAYIDIPFVLFTSGDIRDPKWRPFEVNTIWHHIEAGQLEPGASPTVPTPAPQPEPDYALRWPVAGPARISQAFSATHPAIDLAAPNSWEYMDFHGTPVPAATDGTVWVGTKLEGYGLYAVIDNGVWRTYYAHLADAVGNGEHVSAGDIIGYVGYSGNSWGGAVGSSWLGARGTHLHFEARPSDGQPDLDWGNGYRGRVNPALFFSDAQIVT